MTNYTAIHELLSKHLSETEQELHGHPEELYEPMRYILSLGGKRVRPFLTLAACDLFDKHPAEALHAATAVELFHNFSLIHDDIMDKAPIRRGKITVHEKWNSNIAILSGDAMLVKCYDQLLKYPNQISYELIACFNKTAIQVCEGQQQDMNFENSEKVSSADYTEMIRKKTAVLLGCALEMGAICARVDQANAKRLYAFGEEIGIAFQLIDDYLDVFGNPEIFGKQHGGDILSGKKTWLYIRAREIASPSQQKELETVNSKSILVPPAEKIQKVKSIYQDLKVNNALEEEIEIHMNRAFQHLELIKADLAKIEMLKQFAIQLSQRNS